MKFQMKGLPEMLRTLAMVEREVTQLATVDAALEMAETGAEVAASLAPRGTDPSDKPRLADSMVADLTEVDTTGATAAFGPHRGAFHGMFQEYGTRFHPPQPFLRPAFDSIRLEAVEEARRVFWQHIRRAVRRS